jgi:2-polyprenyl-6-methoxyphenol hydroxylase-like FAD-dependent oxidoreductase
MSADKSKPCAMVIGGSLGGLCAGVCLRAAGWRVSIFERSAGLMDGVDDKKGIESLIAR